MGGGLFSGDPGDVVTLIGAVSHGGIIVHDLSSSNVNNRCRRTLVVVHGDESSHLQQRVRARFPGLECDFVSSNDDIYASRASSPDRTEDARPHHDRVILVDHTPWNTGPTIACIRKLDRYVKAASHRWYCARYVELLCPPDALMRIVRWATRDVVGGASGNDDDCWTCAEDVLRLGKRDEIQTHPVVVLGRPLRWLTPVEEAATMHTVYRDRRVESCPLSRPQCSSSKTEWVQRVLMEESLASSSVLVMSQYDVSLRNLAASTSRDLGAAVATTTAATTVNNNGDNNGVHVCTWASLLRSWWRLSAGGAAHVDTVLMMEPFESLKVRAACLHALRADGFRGNVVQLVWRDTVESTLVKLQSRADVDPDTHFGETLLNSTDELKVLHRLLSIIQHDASYEEDGTTATATTGRNDNNTSSSSSSSIRSSRKLKKK